MFKQLRETYRKYFPSAEPLPAGTHHVQSLTDAGSPYRLHLRIEPDGTGLLIINASTILHLNPTATEYAYYLVKGVPAEQAAQQVEKRYRVTAAQALTDYQELVDRIQYLTSTQDVDPEMYLDFERSDPYTTQLSAPYRLDCALTYRLPPGEDARFAPLDRVKSELSTSEWQQVLDKAWQAGIPHIIFTGGEPTLRDDLPQLIGYTQNIGQVSGLLTDGLRFSEPGYLDSLLQAGLDHMMLILHPDREESWQALSTALSADIFVTTHLTVTPENQDRVLEALRPLPDLGAKAVSLSSSDPSLSAVLVAAREQVASLGLTLVWDLPVPYSDSNPVALEKGGDVPSGAGSAWLYVEPDGDVLPGQGINRVIGNFLRGSWETIWSSRQ